MPEDANGATALVRAARHCQAAAAKLLLEKGSNVNHMMPKYRGTECWTQLILADVNLGVGDVGGVGGDGGDGDGQRVFYDG